MLWAEKCIVLLQLVSWALLLGSAVSQLRLPSPEITRMMLVGSFGQLISSVALMVITAVASEPLRVGKLIVTLVLMVVIAVLSALNRRFETIPRGLLGLLALLSVAVMGVVVLWGETLQFS
ncbi:hypothetical protein ACF3NT_09150 [Naumannella halotolerans]|uniref:hypothetical protein n=1 Tax=Naumannella halotolerans TaxID=993414 RepID=UPI00370D41AB